VRKSSLTALCIAALVVRVFTPSWLYAREPDPQIGFSEIWAYLMKGEESFLTPALPVSDLCYFSAEINAYGELTGVPDSRKLAAYKGRKHLVVAEVGSFSLTHFCLDPAYPVRDALVQSIIAAAVTYDGVQIDFEAIPVRDRDNFVQFLRLLKNGLGEKVLSVALPARLSEAGDVLGYVRIAEIVDRIIIMAYDEHWSTSVPGPVASMEWSGRVAAFALSKIAAPKLVMGLPFYGRAWGDIKSDRAYKFSAVSSLLKDKDVHSFAREGNVPSFRYQELVTVDVYYDDAESLSHRLRLYRDEGIGAVAFWRLGQEDASIWERIRTD
jgi:spore germination protein YaaH